MTGHEIGKPYTDPDGGTWSMLARGLLAADGPYWSYVSPTGHWSQRKQEEAEAAGLVPLVAETELDAAKAAAVAAFDGNALIQAAHAERDHFQDAVHELCEAIRLTVEYVGPKMLPAIDGWSWFDALVKYAPETAQAFVQARFDRNQQAVEAVQRAERDLREGKAVGVEVPAVPAPLDPGNPEHLRQVALVLNHFTAFGHRLGGVDGQRAAAVFLDLIRAEADRLDREAREAAQYAAEAAKLAAVLSDFAIYDTDGSRDDAILAGHLVRRGVRVIEERAEREESGNVCVCGAMRIPTGEVAVTDTDTVHRVGGPCYVDEERAS